MNSVSEIIYHGSYKKIEFPGISKHRFTKDFSWGYYCTKIKDQAERLAEKFNTPTVNIYKIKNMHTLDIKIFEEYTDEWLEFVVNCRNGNIHHYDVVIGPMADNSIYDYIDAYYQGYMNKDKFFTLMKFKYPTHQISFNTIKALDCIEFIDSYEI